MPTPEQPVDRSDDTPGWPRTNATTLAEMRKRGYGRLKVEEETDVRATNGCIVWKCKCRCGGWALVATHNLTSGNTLSCGCVQVERSRTANRKGGARWRKTAAN